MKKRIVALILTVVMSVLALVSCGSYDFVKEDLTSYAEFDLAKFMEALQKLEIEDGEFTTDDTIREAITDATVYNNIVDKIIAQTKEDQQVKTGKLDAGDVLYFVYYALDENGNMIFEIFNYHTDTVEYTYDSLNRVTTEKSFTGEIKISTLSSNQTGPLTRFSLLISLSSTINPK